MREKINHVLSDEAVYGALVLIGVAVASFGLGRQSMAHTASKTPIREAVGIELSTTSGWGMVEHQQVATSTVQYVASKNGTKYHLPWCSGAQRISEQNKVWFETKADAEAAGYTPAANCKGI